MVLPRTQGTTAARASDRGADSEIDSETERRAVPAHYLERNEGLATRASMTLLFYLLGVDISAFVLFAWYPQWHGVLLFTGVHALFNGLLLLALSRGCSSKLLAHAVLLGMQLALFGSILASGGTLISPVVLLLLVFPGYAFALLARPEAMTWIMGIWLSAAGLFVTECWLAAGTVNGALALLTQELPRLYIWNTAYIAFSIFLHQFEAYFRKGQRDRARLHYLANHDQLTRLANRSMFDVRLGNALRQSRESGASVALIYVDLDKFKPINDRLGHGVGDEVLQHIAERLLASTRPHDTIARVGGDEFAIIVEGIEEGVESISLIAEKILQRVNAAISTTAGMVNVAGSIGISLYPTTGQNADELKRQADMAMYTAKRGANAWYVYNEQMTM